MKNAKKIFLFMLCLSLFSGCSLGKDFATSVVKAGLQPMFQAMANALFSSNIISAKVNQGQVIFHGSVSLNNSKYIFTTSENIISDGTGISPSEAIIITTDKSKKAILNFECIDKSCEMFIMGVRTFKVDDRGNEQPLVQFGYIYRLGQTNVNSNDFIAAEFLTYRCPSSLIS